MQQVKNRVGKLITDKTQKNMPEETKNAIPNKKQSVFNYIKLFSSVVLFIMALLITGCSLYMVGITAFERSANAGEAIIIAGVAVCIALSAHLLPALVKGRKSIKLNLLIAFVWFFCISATLYSHTLFFVTTQNDKADVRSEMSPEIKNLEELISQKEKWITEQKVRPMNDINRDIANEKMKIEQILPKVCEKCTTNRAKLNSYEIRRDALIEEKAIVEKVEAEKNKVREMQENIVVKKEEKRTDAVFEKMSKIFPDMSYESLNLTSSITNALLIEILATLFWWLLFPSQGGYKIEGKKGVSQNKIIRLNNEREDDIINAEIVQEHPLSIKHSLSNSNSENLIAFQTEIYHRNKKEAKYIVYDNEIYPLTVEELFVKKLILNVGLRQKIDNFIKTHFISENLIKTNYIKNVFKKDRVAENEKSVFVVHKYTKDIRPAKKENASIVVEKQSMASLLSESDYEYKENLPVVEEKEPIVMKPNTEKPLKVDIDPPVLNVVDDDILDIAKLFNNNENVIKVSNEKPKENDEQNNGLNELQEIKDYLSLDFLPDEYQEELQKAPLIDLPNENDTDYNIVENLNDNVGSSVSYTSDPISTEINAKEKNEFTLNFKLNFYDEKSEDQQKETFNLKNLMEPNKNKKSNNNYIRQFLDMEENEIFNNHSDYKNIEKQGSQNINQIEAQDLQDSYIEDEKDIENLNGENFDLLIGRILNDVNKEK